MAKNSAFKIGKTYTKGEIHTGVGGGGTMTYLPHKNGRVLAICLKKEINPAFDDFSPSAGELPAGVKAILVGKGDNIEEAAKMMTQQHQDPLPTFLKQASNEWEFIGYYTFFSENNSKEAIRHYSKYAESNTDEIVGVIFVREVKEHEQKTVRRKAA